MAGRGAREEKTRVYTRYKTWLSFFLRSANPPLTILLLCTLFGKPYAMTECYPASADISTKCNDLSSSFHQLHSIRRVYYPEMPNAGKESCNQNIVKSQLKLSVLRQLRGVFSPEWVPN